MHNLQEEDGSKIKPVKNLGTIIQRFARRLLEESSAIIMLSRQSTAQRLNATLPVRAMLAADRTQRAGSGSDACDH